MHKMNYQEFKKIIKSLSPLERDNSHLKTTNGLTFLEILFLCLEDSSLKPDLKMIIMSENTFSIKISRSYLGNPDLFYKEESKSILLQIEELYLRDFIRLIDLAYLILFFESDLYEELINKLDFVSTKQHQMHQEFEEIYYKSLDIENLFILKPEDLYQKLEESEIYNIEIHNHIIKLLKKADNDLEKIPYYKKLIKLVEDKSIVFTTDELEMENIKDKIYKFELISRSKIISEKYSLSKSLLEIENLPSNLILIISEFKKEFNNAKDIKRQIEIMKDFTIFMPFVQFSESTSTERLKIYDYVHLLLNLDCKEIEHIREIVRYSNELLEIFFHDDKNVFIDDLRLKIQSLEEIIRNGNSKATENLNFILNTKLLTVYNTKSQVNNENGKLLVNPNLKLNNENLNLKLNNENLNFKLNNENAKLQVNNDSEFIRILNMDSKTPDLIKKVKQIRNALCIFVDIAENISDLEFEMFENEINLIFKIVNRIFNLKIKYFINSEFKNELIHDLQYKIIQYRLFILKFEKGKVTNIKDFLIKNPNICKEYKIASAYLKEVRNSSVFSINIENESDIEKIFDIIPKIFFDKSLFIDTGSVILDELTKTYSLFTKLFQYFDLEIAKNNLNIKKIWKMYKKQKKYKKRIRALPKYLQISFSTNINELLTILKIYNKDNIQEIINDPLKDYKKSINVYKISKYVIKQEIDFNLPETSSIDELKNKITIFKKSLKKIDYEKMQINIKNSRKILKLKLKLTKHNYNSKIEKYNSKIEKYNSKITEYKKLSIELRCIYYQSNPACHHKKLDYLIENSNFDCKEKYKILKELISFEDFADRKLKISKIIENNTELDLLNQLKTLKLSKEIKSKLKLLDLEIQNVCYFRSEIIIKYEDRHKLFHKIEEINLNLHEFIADLNSIDILTENEKNCENLRNKINGLIHKNNSILFLLNDICKFTNTEAFKMLIDEIQKPLNDIELNLIDENNLNYKIILEKQINDLKNKVSELYFVSSEDILNFINGKLSIEDIFKNIYNIDNLIIKDNFCVGIKSKNEEVYFRNKIEQSHKYKNPEDFKIFYENFKTEFKETMISYLKDKLQDTNVPYRINFLDEFINEYRYFNNLNYEETIKIKFLKKHEQELGIDFRTLYPKPLIKLENDILILNTQSLQVSPYELTYFPPTNIIYTKLTNTIFNKITLSINSSSGVILYGESSTGKTETVKYFCKTIGKPLYIFCCNENLNIDLLENIIKGCIKNNWFLCLDECNRLNSNVMSKMSDLLLEIKDKIKVFLTLNIGYLGRNKLPTTLKALFTEIRVDNPDLDDILDIYFNKEIKDLLKSLKEKSHNLPHYNFSLRAINTILQNSNNNDLTRNLLTYYYAIFNENDKLLLKDYISNLSKEDLFSYGIERSTGVLLFGNSQTEKSTLIRNLTLKNNIKYKILHKYDEDILYKIVKENTNNEIWIIYDLILESTWIENLNSVLDDNKILCMKNGEILKIGENIKFIFETNDISNITPATLTRVFTIYFEEQFENKSAKNDLGINFENESVIFLQGEMGSGKRTYFKEITNNEPCLILNCREVKSLLSYDFNLIYLEEYEKANEKLIEEIKEFYEFSTIKDQKREMRLFISYNSKEGLEEYNLKRRINCKIININNKNDKIYKNEFIEQIIKDQAELCLKEIFKFCIAQKINFILVGNRMSGKNWLLKDYDLEIIEIFEETCTIKYNNEKATATLTDDLDLLSKKIIKENLIIKICNVSQFIIDCEEFIKDIENTILDDILKNKFIKNLEFKRCGCCIKKDTIHNNRNINTINNVTNDDKYLSFPNIFKLSDFISTSLEIYKDFSSNAKFILNGLDKIQNFHKISQDKKIDLHKHNVSLNKYQEGLNIKMLEIKKVEEEINLEKISIENKKKQHSVLYNEIQKKKDFINLKLKEGEIKLEESIAKVKKINKKNIAEIRSMNNPPKSVHFIINLIYNIVNNNKKSVPWNELLVFLRSSDIFSVLDCINLEVLDINSLKEKEKEIMKSSHVCYLFYEWIINNYDYKLLKEDIEPLEKEINKFKEEEEIIIRNLQDEEDKVEKLNLKLKDYRNEYLKYSKILENTKEEILILNDEILKYDILLNKIKEERDNWKIGIFNLDMIKENFYKNKILLSNTNINYLSTSTKDINFKKVISNIYKYKNNLFISDVTPRHDIYKLCKYQMKYKDFCLILSQDNTNFYSCIGYNYEVIEKYSVDSNINIKDLEDNLLKTIVDGDINDILESKTTLDLARDELRKIEDIKKYYNKLNEVYKILYQKYELSFKVYKDFIHKNTNNMSLDDLEKEGINYCTNLVLEEIYKYDTNILIVTNTDDYIYYLEKNIPFKEVISIGDKYHNELYKKILSSQDNNLYLVKNIDLYNEIVEDKSNNKFIYISEYRRSKNIVKDCRVLYMKYKFNYERSLQFYKEFFNIDNEEIIELHCKMIKNLYDNKLERKYTFTVKDLELMIKNKEIVSLEYLKYLVYKNKLD